MDYLRDYLAAGFHLVELAPRDKNPTIEGWRTTSATTINLAENNVGILWGHRSNGLVDIDLDCQDAIELGAHILPETGMVFGRESKRRSHYLYYVRPYPEHVSSFKYVDPFDNSCILEIRADGVQTMVPPSIHPSGERAEWDSYAQVPTIEEGPLRLSCGTLASAVLISRQWGEGTRHDATMALTGALLRASWPIEKIEHFVEIICEHVGDHDLADRRKAIQSTYKKHEQGEKTTGWPKLVELWDSDTISAIRHWLGLTSQLLYALTDTGNAERFFDQYTERLYWVPEWNKWVFWTGTRWQIDTMLRTTSFAIDSIKSIPKEADYVHDMEYKAAIFKWANASQANFRIESMMKISKTYFSKTAQEFDADPSLLNVQNGIINLRTGEIVEHNRKYLLTKQAPIDFDPSADCPIFKRIVFELVMEDQSVADYLQLALGYSTTGVTDEDVFFILYGPGRNGKSTVLETVSRVLGDYAKTARAETFFEQNSIPSDLASLVGSRFVSAAETETGAKISDALIKRLTGGDSIKARFMYAEFFDFDPTFKIWLATNHKPMITTQSLAIWERVRLIPCENVIPRHMRDKSLRGSLWQLESSGILNYLIQGAMRWYEHGLGEPPEEIEAAVQEYRREMDMIGDFIDEFCTIDAEGEVTLNELYKAYQAWARENGRPIYGSRRFQAELRDVGYAIEKADSGMNTFKGLKIRERKHVITNNPFGTL